MKDAGMYRSSEKAEVFYMNSEILKKAGIDYDNSVKRMLNDASFFEKMLLKFPEDATFEHAKASFDAGDYVGLYGNIHALKGIAGNLGFTALYRCTEELCAHLRSDKTAESDFISDKFDEISRLYEIILNAIKNA